MKFIATRIHNESIGCVFLYDTLSEALAKAEEIAVGTLNRELYENELYDLENAELVIESDHDNRYIVSIAATED